MNSLFDSSSMLKIDSHSKIHIRIQQMGRKRLTMIEGLDDDLDLKRISRALKKLLSCSATVVSDEKCGDIIQLQGDQRDAVRAWLVESEILTEKEAKERVVIHGV
jgi:translation initiation factor 1